MEHGNEPRHGAVGSRPRWWLVFGISLVLAGVAAVVAGALVWNASLAGSNRSVVTEEAADTSAAVSGVLQRYDDLAAESGSLLSLSFLSPAEISSLTRVAHLTSMYPDDLGLGFISYVPASQLPSFEAAEVGAGDTGFAVSPAGARPFYCLATTVDWFAHGPSPAPVGDDLCSIGWFRHDLLASATTNRSAVIAPGNLGPAYRTDFVLITPFRRGSSSGHGTADLAGWSATLVDGHRLLASAITRHPSVAVALYAGRHPDRATLITSSQTTRAAPAGTVTVSLAGGPTWTIRTTVFDGFAGLTDTWLGPTVLLVLGLAVIAVVALLGLSFARGRRRAEDDAARQGRAHRRSEARFESLAGASPVGILEVNRDFEVTYVNEMMAAIARCPIDELLGRSWLTHVVPEDGEALLEMADDSARGHKSLRTHFRIVRPTGEIRTVSLVSGLASVAGEAGAPERYVVTVEDVTEALALEEALRHQALHDALTGLPNRALFKDRLDLALRQSVREGMTLAVLFMDIDRFKVINDSLGHTVGDALLAQLSERLLLVAREGDTVARLGGDEFLVLLPDVGGIVGAIAVAQRFLTALAEPFELEGRTLVVSMSIGITLAKAGDDADTAIREADAAMYRAKEEGRNRYAVFQEELHERSVGRLTLEEQLRRAIELEELAVYYQPVVALEDGATLSAEALVRWPQPSGQVLGPNRFIPLAEETGLIVPLGEWVYASVVDQMQAWEADPDAPHLDVVHVNLSALQLRDPQAVRAWRQLAEDHRLDPGRFCFEVTETTAMLDDEPTRETLRRINEAGFGIAIDDFGTGYSSLAQLQTLPVTTLKIDRQFVRRLGHAQGDAIVAAVIEMAHCLGLGVIAEGVERELALGILRQMGCDAGQGFLWSEALPAAAFAAWDARSPSRQATQPAPA